MIHDSLLFPYPPTLDRRDPDEARVVRRLITSLREMQAAGLIDPARSDEEETVREEVIQALAGIGMLGLTIPKEYGGLGLSSTAYARVFGTISSLDASLGVLIGVHCGLGSKAIVLFGNDEQKERYLPALARGETLAAYALTEPRTGSDAQHIVTQARRSDDGSHWVLDGEKLWIGNGHRAGVIATFAQTEVERRGGMVQRPTAFIIRPDMPGFRVVETIRKMGIRGSTQARLAYEGLQVPDDHVLGQVGKGFSVAVHVLNGGRLTLAAGCTGATKSVVTAMTAFADERVQFGKPIADFEITQRKIATIAAECYAADAMLGLLSDAMDRGDSDFSLEAACAKVFCSDMVWRAADDMVQVAGGRGFVKPYPYERMLRDSRINRIFEGTNEILRLFIALNGIQGPAEYLSEIGSAIRQPLRNLGLVSGYAASRIRSVVGGGPEMKTQLGERLATHRSYFEKHVGQLKEETDRAIKRYRKDIVDRQMVIERLANMAIELYARGAVLSRTQDLLDRLGERACARELELCDLFCVQSGLRFRANRLGLGSQGAALDGSRRTVAARIRQDDGYAVPDAILDA